MNSLFCQDSTKHRVLAIEHIRKFKRAVFVPGDLIRFQMNDGKAVYSGMLSEVTDTSFVIVHGVTVANLHDVSQRVMREEVLFRFLRTVYIRPNRRTKGWDFFEGMMSGGLIGGGVMNTVLLPIDAALAGSRVNRTSLGIGIGMLVSGALIKLLPKKRRYKIGKKHKVRVMGGL
ncbi:MAG: hypothetical protein AB8F95_02460 [Bacteroidia bacterium]